MRWLDSIADSVDTDLSKVWKIVEDRGAWHVAVQGIAESQTKDGPREEMGLVQPPRSALGLLQQSVANFRRQTTFVLTP